MSATTGQTDRRPSHKVFMVEELRTDENPDRESIWTTVGSAWPHKDGKGLNIQLRSGIAISGRVVLREYTDDDEKAEAEQKKAPARRGK